MRLKIEKVTRWAGDALRVGALLALTVAVSTTGDAQQSRAPDLTQLGLEDLMNLQVTSVSKKEQKISQVASAIFVITQEDIRRSGATNIPDLLRMVPGMDVAQINANTWAISARGFNRQFSNKLLVLIDGRTVYTPLHQGVEWDTQDVPLESIDRIEVIRGPGATVWGANAVNGVINIITKKAGDTPGALLTGGGGTQERAFGTAQYGGTITKDTSYRIFTKYLNRSPFPDLDGQNALDGWHLLHGGFRMDSNRSNRDPLTIQGDLYSGREGASIGHIVSIDPPDNENVNRIANLSGGNVLGRWDHIFSGGSDTTLQFYFDKYARSGPESREDRDTIDFDFQHHLPLSSRQDLIWGAGYRYTADQTIGTIDQAWVPSGQANQLLSGFLQDEITLMPERLFLTIGTKVEHNRFTGFEIQPSASVAWTPTKRHTVWLSVARASRTPSRDERAAYVGLAAFPAPDGAPAELILFGNPHQKSEHKMAYNVGYRAQPSRRLSVDVTTFFNQYTDLATHEPGSPFVDESQGSTHWVLPVLNANQMFGSTRGLEVFTNWEVMHRWTLSPGYAFLQMHLQTDATSQDATVALHTEGSSPRHQAQIRSHVEFRRGFAWDTSASFVSSLPVQEVPSYTRLDTQLTWRFAEQLQVSVVGQNLLRDHHVESNDTFTSVNSSQIKRGAFVRITWRF